MQPGQKADPGYGGGEERGWLREQRGGIKGNKGEML